MKITIIFMGLMLHLDHPSLLVDTMVMPRAGGTHAAEVVIPLSAILNPEILTAGETSAEPGFAVISLHGARMSVDGTRGDAIPKPALYKKSTARMRGPDFKCSTVRTDVLARTATTEFSFVDFAGGSVNVESYLPKKLVLDKGTNPYGECAACSVEWSSDLTGSEARLFIDSDSGPDRTIRVKGDSELEIQNVPTVKTKKHFRHLYDIYTDCKNKIDLQVKGDCTEAERCPADPQTMRPRGLRYPAPDCTIGGEP